MTILRFKSLSYYAHVLSLSFFLHFPLLAQPDIADDLYHLRCGVAATGDHLRPPFEEEVERKEEKGRIMIVSLSLPPHSNSHDNIRDQRQCLWLWRQQIQATSPAMKLSRYLTKRDLIAPLIKLFLHSPHHLSILGSMRWRCEPITAIIITRTTPTSCRLTRLSP